MNDKAFDPVAPSFKPTDTIASPNANRSLWSQEPRKIQYNAPAAKEKTSAPGQSFVPGGLTPNNEHLFSVGNMRPASSIFQSMYTTPPRETSFSTHGSSNSTNTAFFGGEAIKFKPALVPGLLPDEESSIEDKFSVKLGESTEDVISGLKLQVETLITAIMLTSGDGAKELSSTSLQGADAIEISHRIMMRLKLLREENARLAHIANGTLAAKLEARNAELEFEVKMLRDQLAEQGHMETDG